MISGLFGLDDRAHQAYQPKQIVVIWPAGLQPR